MRYLHFTEQTDQDEISMSHHNDDNLFVPFLHTHDYYEIAYVYGGECVHVINERAYSAQKGTVIMMKPGDNHIYHTLTNMDIVHCCYIDKPRAFNAPDDCNMPIVIHLEPYFQLQIEQLFYLLEEELALKKPYYSDALWGFLNSILYIISRNMKEDPYNQRWEDVLKYIVNNLATAEFSEAVKIFGSSDSWFCRAFKKKFSVSFKEFLKKLRIQHAKEMLLNTSYSVTEIYEQCGYNNNRTFFVDFKNLVGTTPNQYRKLQSSD